MHGTSRFMKLVVESHTENTPEDEQEAASMERMVDADIKEFDEYFQKVLGNDPLVRGESAIIKTFLYYHLVHKKTANAAG